MGALKPVVFPSAWHNMSQGDGKIVLGMWLTSTLMVRVMHDPSRKNDWYGVLTPVRRDGSLAFAPRIIECSGLKTCADAQRLILQKSIAVLTAATDAAAAALVNGQ